MNLIQKKIIKIFLYKKLISFNALRKEIEIPSNKLTYHLSKLKKAKIIEKVGDRYLLSDSYKEMFPYLENIFDQQKNPIIIVKVCLNQNKAHFLICRRKEPFYGYWELPTTKLRLGEQIEDAGKRILKTMNIKALNIKVTMQVRELIFNKERVIYDYLIYFIDVNLKDKTLTLKNLFVKSSLQELNLIPTDKLYLFSKLKDNDVIRLNYDEESLTIL